MADVTVEFGATDTGLEKTLKAVQGELNGLKSKVSSGELSMTELESTMKRIGQVTSMEKNIKAIGGSSEATTKSVKTLGTAAEETGKKGESGFSKIAIGAALAVAGTAAIDAAFAVAQKTVQSFGDALSMGGRLKELSDRTGVAVDRLLLLERAFHNAGVGADAVGPIINKMQKAIVDAEDGTSKAADAFTKLGIPLSTLQNLSPEEQLRTIGKAIAGIPNEAERAAISIEVFGKSGGALNQLFSDFDGGIKTAKDQLGSLPALMKGAAEQFDRIDENLFSVGQKFIEFAAGILDKVAPALDALTTALTRIDAAKIGQELAGFFIGAGEGMKGFQAAVDAIEAGEMGTAFKIVGQAIQLQFKETANNVYTNIVAAFKTIGDFIMEQFASGGPLVMTITSTFDFVAGYIKKVVSGTLFETFTNLGPAFSRIAAGLKDSAEAGALSADLALQRIPIAAGLAAEKAGKSMGNIPENFKENMAGVPPLFTDLEKHQQEIDKLQQGITESTKDTTTAVSELDKANAKAEQEARKKAAEDAKNATKALEDAEKAAKAEAEKQAKIEEVLRLKREEHNAQMDINNAIASGNSQEAEALKNAESLRKTIQGLVSSGFGEDEATKMANEMARAAREADRMKNSLATKIGTDIKARQESEAVDPGGKLMKKAQEQISTGAYKAAEVTGAQLKTREQEAMIRGVGSGTDRRALSDIAKDYGLDTMGKTSTQLRDELYKIRTEGQGTSDKMSKSLESAKKGLGEGIQKEGKAKSAEKDKPMKLDEMVRTILKLIEKIEPKLPTAALST